MVSSKTLKTFIRMHEYKLNAKISGLRADQLESEVEPELHHGTHSSSGSVEHWNLSEASRKRPKSRYFDFIMTNAHQ